MLGFLSHIQLFVNLWIVAHQTPLSMGYSSQEYWNGLPYPPPSTSASLTLAKLLIVYHNKLWKILKEMGIPDHLTCLLWNLYAGQEETARTGHGATDWFKIGKGVHQGCIHKFVYAYTYILHETRRQIEYMENMWGNICIYVYVLLWNWKAATTPNYYKCW